MAKETRYLSFWIEVAPALLISKTKVVPAVSTVLETITEEEEEKAEGYDQE